eukprot:TRINITY_DN2760_c0_g1_i3.p1 TRINITY_DN2760_c0_g1~~TRINITY_DN2760_c0_g1_i3.p1  ORF type:complete len:168 (+),score=25.84 TRINITY_DN2760_c0_g1_i3:203-706(+)
MESEPPLLREQDRYLPIANISRIMKKALPSNAKIAKEAKETVQECVSEFISFITSEASDKCQQEKRKTINGEDILWAMTSLGFDQYHEPLKIYLHKYRESTPTKRQPKRETRGEGSPPDAQMPMYPYSMEQIPFAAHALALAGGGVYSSVEQEQNENDHTSITESEI